MNDPKKKVAFDILYIFIMLILIRFFENMIQPMISNAFVGRLIYQIIFTAMAVFSAVLFKKTSVLKFQTAGFVEGIKTGLLLIVLFSFMLVRNVFELRGTITASGVEIVMFAAQMLLVGVTEEVMFRGVLQNLTLDVTGENTVAAVRKGILLSGVFFGLVHISNLVAGVSLNGAVDQAVMAVPMGVLLGIIYFRGKNNLLVPILIHALVDSAGFISQGVLSGVDTSDAISQIGSAGSQRILSFCIYVVLVEFLMRKSVMEKAIESRS